MARCQPFISIVNPTKYLRLPAIRHLCISCIHCIFISEELVSEELARIQGRSASEDEASINEGISKSIHWPNQLLNAARVLQRYRKVRARTSHTPSRCQRRTRSNACFARNESPWTMSMYHRSRACRVRYCFLTRSTNTVVPRRSARSSAARYLHKRKLVRTTIIHERKRSTQCQRRYRNLNIGHQSRRTL